jgi:hypothetical protein
VKGTIKLEENGRILDEREEDCLVLSGSGQLTFSLYNKVGTDINITSVEATYKGGSAWNFTNSGIIKPNGSYTVVLTGLPTGDRDSSCEIYVDIIFTKNNTGTSIKSSGILRGIVG